MFCAEVPILIREHLNGNYRIDAYYITKQLADLPIYLTTPVIFGSIFYWIVGLNPDAGRFFLTLLILVLFVQAVISACK